MWKINNKTDPGYQQECVGDYSNMGGGNISTEGSIGGVQADTHDSVILRKR